MVSLPTLGSLLLKTDQCKWKGIQLWECFQLSCRKKGRGAASRETWQTELGMPGYNLTPAASLAEGSQDIFHRVLESARKRSCLYLQYPNSCFSDWEYSGPLPSTSWQLLACRGQGKDGGSGGQEQGSHLPSFIRCLHPSPLLCENTDILIHAFYGP